MDQLHLLPSDRAPFLSEFQRCPTWTLMVMHSTLMVMHGVGVGGLGGSFVAVIYAGEFVIGLSSAAALSSSQQYLNMPKEAAQTIHTSRCGCGSSVVLRRTSAG